MQRFARGLIVVGDALAVVGVLLTLVGRVPFLGRLPGDFRIERPGFRFYFPLTTSLLLSLLLSAIVWLLRR